MGINLNYKLMSKRSRYWNVSQRAAGWCEGGIREFTEWACEGDSKPVGVDVDGNPVRYQWGTHDGA